jgi:hypothetical protein
VYSDITAKAYHRRFGTQARFVFNDIVNRASPWRRTGRVIALQTENLRAIFERNVAKISGACLCVWVVAAVFD